MTNIIFPVLAAVAGFAGTMYAVSQHIDKNPTRTASGEPKASRNVLKIAKDVRKEVVKEYGSDDLNAYCMEASEKLALRLNAAGFKTAKAIRGWYEVDEGIIEDDSDEERFDPTHYWVEVDGKILDITGSQFQEFVSDELPDIAHGSYKQLGRYHRS